MDFEPWWLILVPVLFGLGWIAARVDIRQMLSENRRLPDSYFKGLNFLLNEQPDRAIDAFVEVAKLDPETVELHFALGSLFRRRGELERAIRVHQNLLQRDDLPDRQREHALHELAQDYLKAGMLDRAEAGFEQLKSSRYAADALRALIRIYEAERDWPRAIAAVHTLQGLVDEPVPQAVHYHCEQAVAALAAKPPEVDAAHAALDAAVHAAANVEDPGGARGVRIALLRADLAALEGDARAERVQLESILSGQPDYAGSIANRLLENHRATDSMPVALQALESLYEQHPSVDLFDAIFRARWAIHGSASAWEFARAALQRHPSLLGLDRLLEAQLKHASPDTADAHWISDDDAALVRSLILRHTQRLGRYTCRACGFRAKRFYWQCPGCNAWETYSPKRLEELESA